MACDACEQNLKSELGAKDESELTEEEKAVLEGEAEAPKYYGPLSSWDGDYCEFCHGIGQAGALAFGGVFGMVAYDFTNLGTGILVGLVIWVGLATVVGYVGRFPVLGALFGPMIEKIFAVQFGIYLTEKAKDTYGTGTPQTETRGHQQTVENRFPFHGAQMHLVAAPWALEKCVDMDVQGALLRVEVDNGQIVDVHNFHPQFNKVRNLQDHVGFRNPNINNVCQAEAQTNGPTTVLDFNELVGSQGQGGVQ